MMKAERGKTEKGETAAKGAALKGTRPRRHHSKFSINDSEDPEERLRPSAQQKNAALGNENLFKMSAQQKECTRPETFASTDMISTNGTLVAKKRSLRSATHRRATSAEEPEEEEPKQKHHLEQVFISSPLDKRS